METLERQFNSRVSAFLGRTGLRPTTSGMKALGDPNLMRRIDGGRSLSLRTAEMNCPGWNALRPAGMRPRGGAARGSVAGLGRAFGPSRNPWDIPSLPVVDKA